MKKILIEMMETSTKTHTAAAMMAYDYIVHGEEYTDPDPIGFKQLAYECHLYDSHKMFMRAYKVDWNCDPQDVIDYGEDTSLVYYLDEFHVLYEQCRDTQFG